LPELVVVPDGASVSVDAERVATWEANDNLVLTAYELGETRWIDVGGVAAYAFRDTGAVRASGAEVDDELIRDVWLRSVLPLVVQARGTEVLHASAVRRADGDVVAFCGRATAGKSTLAASLMQGAGLEVVADDALPFSTTAGGATVHPLPFRLRLRPASALAFGMSSPAPQSRASGRARLASIVILDPTSNEPATLEPLRAGEAFAALMPHAYCFSLENAKPRLVSVYTELCSNVPVHRLRYPRDLSRLDESLRAIAPLVATG
jgi:hypothetical protein